jgi:hypothetical protein
MQLTLSSDLLDLTVVTVSGLVTGRCYAIAIAAEGFRPPPNPGAAFFDLLSRDATAFTIGDGERRTLTYGPGAGRNRSHASPDVLMPLSCRSMQ